MSSLNDFKIVVPHVIMSSNDDPLDLLFGNVMSDSQSQDDEVALSDFVSDSDTETETENNNNAKPLNLTSPASDAGDKLVSQHFILLSRTLILY